MAQYFMQPDQQGSIYGDLGSLLGAGLGGLGSYAMNQMQRPGKIDKLIKSGATPEQAEFLVDMPPAQQMQFFTQKIKQASEDAKRAALSKVLGTAKTGTQNQTITNDTGNLDTNLSALGGPSSQLTSGQRRDAAAESGLYDINDMEKIDKMLSREDEAKEKRIQRQEDRTERQEKLQRKDIHETTKKWKEESKKADKDIHALEEMKILREDPESFTPALLRRGLTKLGFGDYFKGKEEEAYGKITEGLVMDKAAELASSGKMTAALMDRVRLRFPSLENTPEGAEVVTNILGREAMEKKVYNGIYNELRKQGGWKKGSEPIDILEQVDEIAEPILEKMRKEANEALKKDIGYTESDEAVDKLNEQKQPPNLQEGMIARNKETGQPMAQFRNGKWQPIEG